jgi:hypothetical protein
MAASSTVILRSESSVMHNVVTYDYVRFECRCPGSTNNQANKISTVVGYMSWMVWGVSYSAEPCEKQTGGSTPIGFSRPVTALKACKMLSRYQVFERMAQRLLYRKRDLFGAVSRGRMELQSQCMESISLVFIGFLQDRPNRCRCETLLSRLVVTRGERSEVATQDREPLHDQEAGRNTSTVDLNQLCGSQRPRSFGRTRPSIKYPSRVEQARPILMSYCGSGLTKRTYCIVCLP